MKMTLSSVLYPLFPKLLTEAVRLLQIYAKLREFEIPAEVGSRADDAFPSADIRERARECRPAVTPAPTISPTKPPRHRYG